MPETYSRLGSVLIKKETTENTAVIPNVSVPINDEDIADDYSPIASTPIQASRAMNQRALSKAHPAPAGSMNLNIEPETFGHFLNGLCGGLSSGKYIPLSGITGTFTVGETITGGTSAATATVVYYYPGGFLLVSGGAGTFTAAETVTGGTSGATATVTKYAATVYGHCAILPNEIDVTYTLQKNYVDRAVRYMGVKFHSLDSLAQSDNVMTAGIKMTARSAFHGAYVTTAVTAGAGAKTILVDQTQGLVNADSIKVYRPSTGAFLDFASAGVKTHSIGSFVAETSIAITNLETSLAAGDIIVLAPITPSYSVQNEFTWIGGSQIQLGATRLTLADIDAQDYTMVIDNEVEERHAAQGITFADRFPSDILQKGFTANGSFTLHNENENYRSLLRKNTTRAIELDTQGGVIGATTFNYELKVLFTNIQFQANDLPLSADDIVNEEVPFDSYYDTTAGHCARILLVNDITSY